MGVGVTAMDVDVGVGVGTELSALGRDVVVGADTLGGQNLGSELDGCMP